jgi:CxxC motif-containing protein (DUF1111 family)
MSVDIEFVIYRIYNRAMSTRRNGRGRPPKGSAETKTESLLLRLSISEKQGFLDAAQLAGVPLTVWIRERLRQVAARELQSAEKPVAFLS